LEKNRRRMNRGGDQVRVRPQGGDNTPKIWVGWGGTPRVVTKILVNTEKKKQKKHPAFAQKKTNHETWAVCKEAEPETSGLAWNTGKE